MSQHLSMIIDSSKCIDCKACVLACKTANRVPPTQWRNWIKSASYQTDSKGKTDSKPSSHYQPGACMHCANAPCVQACPTGATRIEANSMVSIDSKLCIGCGNCISACPYGARFKNSQTHVADKCDYCAERRSQGLLPACVDTCPTQARAFGDLNDPQSLVAQLTAHNQLLKLEPVGQATTPNLQYLKTTAPTDWPQATAVPASMQFLSRVLNPALKGLFALTCLGLSGTLIRQYFFADKPQADQPKLTDQEK